MPGSFDLIRNMLGKMQRAEYANGRNAELRAWVEEIDGAVVGPESEQGSVGGTCGAGGVRRDTGPLLRSA